MKATSKSTNMIVMTGGGSGGHLTPLMSVAESLRALSPATKIVYIGQKGDGLGDIMKDNPLFDAVYTIHAGKFRRYHGEGWKQILDVATMYKNARDFFLVLAGLVESWRLLGTLQPRVILCKGGFVGVPVGFAAAARRIPYVTHDSDSLPGLANRLIARSARIHAVALPKEIYAYPQAKTITVGVPVQKHFKYVTKQIKEAARQKLGVPSGAKVLFVIGGGLGAIRINRAVTDGAKQLFRSIPKLYIYHVAGRGDEAATNAAYTSVLTEEERRRVQVLGFTSEVAQLSAAADVAITRAGATNMAEFAQQGKACIVVPNPVLTGGHQLKNASVYYKADAAVVLLEADLGTLPKVTAGLMEDAKRRAVLGENLRAFATPKAAENLAQLLLTFVEGR